MKWRAEFFAFYTEQESEIPTFTMATCPEPRIFYDRLYRGAGGYRQTVNESNHAVFESASGVWHLYGEREENENGA